MEFTFTTSCDHKAMTAMARALRKTVRARRSRRSHVFGWIIVLLGAFLSLPFGESFQISVRVVITWLATILVLAALLWEDQLNGYFACKQSLPGLHSSTTTFSTEGYHSVTEVGSSDFPYSNISALAETKDYFVLIFGENHAQVYAKEHMVGGSREDFRAFIEEKAGKSMLKV